MSTRSFEPLESRQLLASFAFNSAWTENATDRDGDSFNRSVEIWFNVSGTGTGSGNFYVDVFEDDGPTDSDWLVRTSSTPLIAGSNTDLGVAIPADLLGLPGDDTDGVAEFRLNLVNADTLAIVQTWTVASSTALGNVRFESAAQDAVSGDIPPALSNFTVNNPGPVTFVTPGDQITLSVRVLEDVQPQFVLFWIDKDGNGVPNPETDSIGSGGSSIGMLASGNITDGIWSTTITADASWGIGNITLGVIAADTALNYALPITTVVRLNQTPSVAALTVSSPLITLPETLTLTATAFDPDGSVSRVTFYIDVDQDGGWTGGTDIDLGFDNSSAGGWTRTVTPQLSWGTGDSRILAAARDNDGGWGQPSSTIIRLNNAPRVTAASVTVNSAAATVITHGDLVRLSASASDLGGSIARVVFTLDNDANGAWTPGVDVDLGFDTDGTDGWGLSFTVPSSFAAVTGARIIADAVDVDGVWASVRSTATVRVNDRPAVTLLMVPPLAAAGQSLRLTASAADSNLRAVSFFIDRDGDGAFSSGDVDLGADFTSGDGWTRNITVLASWAGTVEFRANALDTDGAWGRLPPRQRAVLLSAGPLVTSLSTSISGSIGAGEAFTVTGSVSAGVSARAMTFFIDVNGDRAWTSGLDIDLGSDNDAGNGFTRSLTALSSWGDVNSAQIVANAVNNATQWGERTRATSAFTLWAGPRVTNLAVASTLGANLITHDRLFSLTATLPATTGVRGVSFFYDVNNNGGWDAGTDRDLGSDFDGSDGWGVSPRANAAWGTPSAARFIASAVSTSGAWGRTGTASTPVRVNDRAGLADLRFSANDIAQGSQVTVSVDASDAWGAGVITMFADVDGSGFWTPGVDIDLGAAVRTGGSETGGTWSITLTANWAPGTMRIVADARDSDGAWSGRRVNSLLNII